MKPAKAQNLHWPKKKHREVQTNKPTQDTQAQSANGHLLAHLVLPAYWTYDCTCVTETLELHVSLSLICNFKKLFLLYIYAEGVTHDKCCVIDFYASNSITTFTPIILSHWNFNKLCANKIKHHTCFLCLIGSCSASSLCSLLVMLLCVVYYMFFRFCDLIYTLNSCPPRQIFGAVWQLRCVVYKEVINESWVDPFHCQYMQVLNPAP